jgi:hypothetical protein
VRQPRVDALEVSLYARGIDRSTLWEGDHRQQRRGIAAGSLVVGGDLDIRLPALLVRNRELGIQSVGGGTGRGDPGDHERDPADDNGLLVGENPTGQSGHGCYDPTRRENVTDRE